MENGPVSGPQGHSTLSMLAAPKPARRELRRSAASRAKTANQHSSASSANMNGTEKEFSVSVASMNNTAALAPAAGMDLGLDHPDRATQLLRCLDRLLHGERGNAARHGDGELAQDVLGLVLVDFQSSLRQGWAGLSVWGLADRKLKWAAQRGTALRQASGRCGGQPVVKVGAHQARGLCRIPRGDRRHHGAVLGRRFGQPALLEQ